LHLRLRIDPHPRYRTPVLRLEGRGPLSPIAAVPMLMEMAKLHLGVGVDSLNDVVFSGTNTE
jgi:hypothetical protein